MDTINIIGATASCVGLMLTIAVYCRIRRIEKRFSSQALLPVYLKKLGGSLKNLVQHQRTKDPSQTRKVLATCRVILGDLRSHLVDERAADVAGVIIKVDRLLQLESDEILWEESAVIIPDLYAVQETTDNFLQEMKWRGPNAK